MIRTSSPARLAGLTVGLPLLGAALALWDALHNGVRRTDVLIFVAMYAICAFGTEVGFHRLVSHRAFNAKPSVTAALCAAGSMAAQGPPLFWATVHRQHHARTDRDGDPHSPHAGGPVRSVSRFLHAHVGWLFVPPNDGFHAPIGDLLRDVVVVRINRLYPLWLVLGVVLPAATGLLFTGRAEGALRAALWGGFLRIAVWQQVTWSVNSFGHLFGSRPFATRDRSVNNVALALLTFGGAWHNNHHAFPSSARVGLRPWEIDMHYALIRLLAAVGLVSAVRVPGRAKLTTALTQGKGVRRENVRI